MNVVRSISRWEKKILAVFFSSATVSGAICRRRCREFCHFRFIKESIAKNHSNEMSIIALALCFHLLLLCASHLAHIMCGKMIIKNESILVDDTDNECLTVCVILHGFRYFFFLSHLLFTCNHQLISIVQPCLQHLTYIYK